MMVPMLSASLIPSARYRGTLQHTSSCGRCHLACQGDAFGIVCSMTIAYCEKPRSPEKNASAASRCALGAAIL